ncbi:c-type cytochrome [Psychrobacter sp. I-STPA10]|uniref:c-type cytochrome n=1 Tax=Psychrobacter sp. I-STPA10 TaxID=2585769 RepID=UPI001E467978|nr:c-type cytochrome [Psychrobacter sp. I-STPA10]
MTSKSKRQTGLSMVAIVMVLGILSLVISTGAQAASNAQANAVATLYTDSCAACHDTGALGAPKTGDKATWQRLQSQKGMASLVSSVKNGMPQMPAGGLCSECTDAQYRQLIEYMAKDAD